MSCSFLVYATRSFQRELSVLGARALNDAMTGAVQRVTSWDPNKSMDVTWMISNEELGFNVLPFKVDIELNRADIGPEINRESLIEEIAIAVFDTLKKTDFFIDTGLGVFPKIPAVSKFYMGPEQPQQVD